MFLGAIYGVLVPSLILIAALIYQTILRPISVAPSFSDLLLLGLGFLSAFLVGGGVGIVIGFFAGAVIGLISGIILGLTIFRRTFTREFYMDEKTLRVICSIIVFCIALVVFGTAFGILMSQRQETFLILLLLFVFLVLIPALLAAFGASKRIEIVQDWYNEHLSGEPKK